MKTIKQETTQETITGKVQSIEATGEYLVEFVIKTIKEGNTTWLNVKTSNWQAWSLKAGDRVSMTGEVTSSVWEDPFLNEEVETFEMKATSLKLAV